jgi:hypothetical protein
MKLGAALMTSTLPPSQPQSHGEEAEAMSRTAWEDSPGKELALLTLGQHPNVA